MTIFPQLEKQLSVAAAAPFAASRGPLDRLRSHLGLPTIAAVALIAGGTAAAATKVWDPIFGSKENPVSVVRAPAPAEQSGAIEVLRRPATAEDRGQDVQATLRRLDGRLTQGVYQDTVRKLAAAPNGQAVVLFAAQEFGDLGDDRRERYSVRTPLCVAYPTGGPSVNSGCWQPAAIAAGAANAAFMDTEARLHVYGLVPDGVARVGVRGSEPSIEQRVADNYFELTVPAGESATGNDLVWFAANGSRVERKDAAP